MAQIRIALAQVNPTVGDLLGNRALVIETTAKAAAAGADLVAFPEMMLTGYPIEDLALRPSFQRACDDSLRKLAEDLDAVGLSATTVIVGHVAPVPADATDRRGYNAAATLHGGRVVADYAKHHLPNELVFDGDSMVVGADGNLIARSPQFVDDLLIVDLNVPAASGTTDVHLPAVSHTDSLTPRIAPPLSDAREVYLALVTGLRDYLRKNGFRSVVLGMSGGIDSALVAALACDAVGPQNVHGVRMPSQYSSAHSMSDAAASAELTGMNLRTVPINDMVSAYQHNLDLTGLAAENLQARVRGAILMGISNAEGHLVLATGNKSELAVGYSTIYGDAVGGFAPIKDVPKTLVWQMSRWRNESAARSGTPGPIPANSIEKPPSAELRPDQLDSDSLPDYVQLDLVLEDYVGGDLGAAELVARGYDAELVARIVHLTDAAEWKRRQYPPGTKITFRAFGRDRRLPITNRWRERLD